MDNVNNNNGQLVGINQQVAIAAQNLTNTRTGINTNLRPTLNQYIPGGMNNVPALADNLNNTAVKDFEEAVIRLIQNNPLQNDYLNDICNQATNLGLYRIVREITIIRNREKREDVMNFSNAVERVNYSSRHITDLEGRLAIAQQINELTPLRLAFQNRAQWERNRFIAHGRSHRISRGIRMV